MDAVADPFAAFLRRLCEFQAYALAGDPAARMVMGEYGLNTWCGVPPHRALAQAESSVRAAYPDAFPERV